MTVDPILRVERPSCQEQKTRRTRDKGSGRVLTSISTRRTRVANTPLPQSPPGFPCWGLEFSSVDSECRHCNHQVTCRDAYIGRNSISVPVPPPPPPQFATQYAPQGFQVPPPPPPPPPQTSGWRNVPAQYQPPASPPVYQPTNGWAPVAPPPPPPQMQVQPGTNNGWVQQYHPQSWQGIIGLHPGETVTTRVGKNVGLRMAESAFSELARFFHYYTWPPASV